MAKLSVVKAAIIGRLKTKKITKITNFKKIFKLKTGQKLLIPASIPSFKLCFLLVFIRAVLLTIATCEIIVNHIIKITKISDINNKLRARNRENVCSRAKTPKFFITIGLKIPVSIKRLKVGNSPPSKLSKR